MSTVTLFKNRNGNVNVALTHLGSVSTVAFISGKFFTTDKRLEATLTDLAEHGEFGIYIDSEEKDIDPQYATPMDQMKKKVRDELLAELRAEGLLKDAGTSTQAPLQQSIGTSADAIVGAQGLSDPEQALKEAQIAELNKPTQTNTTLSAADMLAKLKPQA